ncbi:MAG: hypothetical protein CM15mP86_07180 [Gammaproteobacteria bacterium]|nr:MAG: hypothetical protein CM15mP86_07180 [Gammaproteobacteria bacterium]
MEYELAGVVRVYTLFFDGYWTLQAPIVEFLKEQANESFNACSAGR